MRKSRFLLILVFFSIILQNCVLDIFHGSSTFSLTMISLGGASAHAKTRALKIIRYLMLIIQACNIVNISEICHRFSPISSQFAHSLRFLSSRYSLLTHFVFRPRVSFLGRISAGGIFFMKQQLIKPWNFLFSFSRSRRQEGS